MLTSPTFEPDSLNTETAGYRARAGVGNPGVHWQVGWLSSRMRVTLGSTFSPSVSVNRSLGSVTLVVSLMNHYLETPLSHVAQIDALFLSWNQSARGPFSPYAFALWCPNIIPWKKKNRAQGVGLSLRTHAESGQLDYLHMCVRELQGPLVTRGTWEPPGIPWPQMCFCSVPLDVWVLGNGEVKEHTESEHCQYLAFLLLYEKWIPPDLHLHGRVQSFLTYCLVWQHSG